MTLALKSIKEAIKVMSPMTVAALAISFNVHNIHRSRANVHLRLAKGRHKRFSTVAACGRHRYARLS